MHAGWIFLDLAKGIYSHEILLAKLRFCEIQRMLSDCFLFGEQVGNKKFK